MTFFQSLGQDFTTLIENISEYFTHSIILSPFPADIKAVLLACMTILLIIAVKRAVIS